MSRMLQALKQLDSGAAIVASPPSGRQMESASSASQTAGTTYEMSLLQGPGDTRLARQFRRLADHLIGELPLENGGTILLSGVGNGSHVADIAGWLGQELAQRCQRDTLLIDGDGTRKVLSQRFAAMREPALAEILNEGRSVRGTIVSSVVPQLKFLPFGLAPISRRTLAWPAVQSLLAGLKRDFRYIVVAGDSAQSPLTEAMARFCDGTCLVVSLGRADKRASAEAAGKLVASGARMLGCLVTGVA